MGIKMKLREKQIGTLTALHAEGKGDPAAALVSEFFIESPPPASRKISMFSRGSARKWRQPATCLVSTDNGNPPVSIINKRSKI